ncbi:hypothetical protein HDU90_004973 [Geranomyces variabilis]|nr:hypothetical protein HDU90_004973 [Geranomyces variabilis]
MQIPLQETEKRLHKILVNVDPASDTPIDVEATASVTPIDVEATISVTATEMDNFPIWPTDAAADADVVPIIEIDDGPEEPGAPLKKNEPEAELHGKRFADEIDNEMDDTKHAQSLLLYEEEQNQRKSGL